MMQDQDVASVCVLDVTKGDVKRKKKEKSVRLPVHHWPLSYLYSAKFLVVCAGQVEAALLLVASRAARAEAMWRRRQRGGAGAWLVDCRDLHAVGLKGLLIHKLVILRRLKSWDSVLLVDFSITSLIGSAKYEVC